MGISSRFMRPPLRSPHARGGARRRRFLQATSSAPQARFRAARSPRDRQASRPRIACNIPRNTGSGAATEHLVRITYPFHPFSGQQLLCVGERYNRSGRRLLLRIDDKSYCSVPPKWTDMSEPDPEISMGRERALFTVNDLTELALLVRRLSYRRAGNGTGS
jgi:hypothetical protein